MGKKGFGYRVKQAEHVGKGKKNKKKSRSGWDIAPRRRRVISCGFVMARTAEGGGIITTHRHVGRMWVGFCNGRGGGSGSDEIEGYH